MHTRSTKRPNHSNKVKSDVNIQPRSRRQSTVLSRKETSTGDNAGAIALKEIKTMKVKTRILSEIKETCNMPITRSVTNMIDKDVNFKIVEVYRCMPLLGSEQLTAPDWDIHIAKYAVVFLGNK